jgi:hypothetical protein
MQLTGIKGSEEGHIRITNKARRNIMMDKTDKEKMLGFMMDMCSKGMSDQDKSKMKEQMEACCKNMESMMSPFKDMCKGMPEGFKSCCGQMVFSEFTKGCCGTQGSEKAKA